MTELPDRARVLLGDEDVGVLIRHEEHSRFEPAEGWAERPAGQRPVLGQQFEEDPYAAHVGRSRYGVPLWFEHLLPEVDGALRSAVARAAELSPSRGFALLLLLGEDLPGAIRVRAEGPSETLRTVARRVRMPDPDQGERQALPLRVSLAGVQFKISARVGKRGIAVPGWDEEGDWIVKFASQRFLDLPQNEFLTMRWARAAGLDVPEVRLVATAEIEGIDNVREVAGELAFAIKRYDRPAGGRIHQEDFAQVLGMGTGDAKYERTNVDTIVNIVASVAPEDVDELLARLVFCVLCGNDDAHAKNWSLWYPDPTRARLSPAYDLVSTVQWFSDNPMALKLSGHRRFETVGLAAFGKLAERAGRDPRKAIAVARCAGRRALEAWEAERDAPYGVPAYRTLVDGWLEQLPLAREIRAS